MPGNVYINCKIRLFVIYYFVSVLVQVSNILASILSSAFDAFEQVLSELDRNGVDMISGTGSDFAFVLFLHSLSQTLVMLLLCVIESDTFVVGD